MTSILDKKFKYTPAASTDIRRTFNRVRKQIAAAQEPAKRGVSVSPCSMPERSGPVSAATQQLAYRRIG